MATSIASYPSTLASLYDVDALMAAPIESAKLTRWESIKAASSSATINTSHRMVGSGLQNATNAGITATCSTPFSAIKHTPMFDGEQPKTPRTSKSLAYMTQPPPCPPALASNIRAQAPKTPSRSASYASLSSLAAAGTLNSTASSIAPLGSTSSVVAPKTPKNYSDRFIPTRDASAIDFQMHAMHSHKDENVSATTPSRSTPSRLKAEHNAVIARSLLNTTELNSKILTFKQKAPKPSEHHQSKLRVLYTQNKQESAAALGGRIRQTTRYIATAPERVLDAPELCDDFYVNLLDWSATNMMAVALGSAVYLWDAATGTIDRLCELSNENDLITSVQFMLDGTHVALGTASANNEVQLWNIEGKRQIRSLKGHEARVGSLAWNQHILTSGSRDTTIIHHDVRMAQNRIATLRSHCQEICGLKWSVDGTQLASGGNDNTAMIWDYASTGAGNTAGHALSSARYTFTDSCAAVKALAWCPFQRNTLATGSGTADRNIRFYNTTTGILLNSIDTQSQVTSLQWSKSEKELLSAHGHSNKLTVWKYPSLAKIADLEGHTARILHTAVSPDGSSVVSAGADETIRFWKVWDPVDKSNKLKSGEIMNNSSSSSSQSKSSAPRRGALTMSLR